MKNKKQIRLSVILVAVILVLDQLVKILVKTNMQIGEEFMVLGTWFRIHFVENEGMAFGMSFGGSAGKIILTLIRFVASAFLVWFLARLVRRDTRTSLIVCLSLILAGAVGNIIDSCFYGLLFSDSYYHVATFLPEGGGYAPLLFGRVVDMFYFPLFSFNWPTWMPFVGGKHFEFFNAIFNVADSAITVGIVWLIIDQIFIAPKYLKSEPNE